MRFYCLRHSNLTSIWVCVILVCCMFIVYYSRSSSMSPVQTMKMLSERVLRHHVKVKYHCNVLEYIDDVQEHFNCVQPKITPRFDICLHELKSDKYISTYIVNKGQWEPHITKQMQEILRDYPEAAFIDAGANIGYFSLLAAAMGHTVVAIEPLDTNANRIRRSVIKNAFTSRFTIVKNGLSNKRQLAQFVRHSFNQGNTRLNDIAVDVNRTHGVGLITLDDLLEVVNFDTAIMKMDIQGYEHKAFYKATCSKLLQYVDIKYIFLEWEIVKKVKGNSVFKMSETDINLVDDMVVTLIENGFEPYSLKYKGTHNNAPSSVPLFVGNWKSWPVDIIWKKVKK